MSEIRNSIFGRIFFTATGVIAVICVLIGLFGLIAPAAAITTVSIIFGVYLVLAGLIRIFVAVRSKVAQIAMRWVVGIIGGIILAAGLFALFDRDSAVLALALVIGIGWLADGLGYLLSFATTRNPDGSRNWEQLLLGAVFFFGGLAMIVLQNEGFAVLFWWICLLLLIVGAATIVWLISSAATYRKMRASAGIIVEGAVVQQTPSKNAELH